jgi:hypothetical protein
MDFGFGGSVLALAQFVYQEASQVLEELKVRLSKKW